MLQRVCVRAAAICYMYQVCTKQALCRFFEDKHVKVSLFLQDGIQKSDGTSPLVEEHVGTGRSSSCSDSGALLCLGAP